MELPKFSDKLKTTYLPKHTAEGKQRHLQHIYKVQALHLKSFTLGKTTHTATKTQPNRVQVVQHACISRYRAM